MNVGLFQISTLFLWFPHEGLGLYAERQQRKKLNGNTTNNGAYQNKLGERGTPYLAYRAGQMTISSFYQSNIGLIPSCKWQQYILMFCHSRTKQYQHILITNEMIKNKRYETRVFKSLLYKQPTQAKTSGPWILEISEDLGKKKKNRINHGNYNCRATQEPDHLYFPIICESQISYERKLNAQAL